MYAYGRDSILAQGVEYVKTYLLATIRYKAQNLPAPATHTQLTIAMTWHILRWATFIVLYQRYKNPRGKEDELYWTERTSAGPYC